MPWPTDLVARVVARHLVAARKPDDVVLPVKAVSSSRGKTYEHAAFIRPSPYKQGRFVVVIDGTSGQWYVEDFLADRGPLAIDFGQGWILENADEVRAAVREWWLSPASVAPAEAEEAAPRFDLSDSVYRLRQVADNNLPTPVRRRQLRNLLDQLRSPVRSLFGPGDGDFFERAVAKLRSAEGVSRTAKGLYDDLPLDNTGWIGEKIREGIDSFRAEAHDLLQRARRAERAWERWDVDALVGEGVLADSDRRHLRDAWEAQQRGDEAGMDRHISEVRAASSRAASSREVMEFVLPSHDLYKLVRAMQGEKDEQSADLAVEVYQKLADRLSLSDNEEHALNRLRNSADRIGSWDAATQRNNIFKAANLLGIRLPSHMFASTEGEGQRPGSVPGSR